LSANKHPFYRIVGSNRIEMFFLNRNTSIDRHRKSTIFFFSRPYKCYRLASVYRRRLSCRRRLSV